MSDLAPVKNGAVIFVVPYDEYYRCDAYELEIMVPVMGGYEWATIAYFRITEASLARELPAHEPVDYVIHEWTNWFDRRPGYSTMICKNYTKF